MGPKRIVWDREKLYTELWENPATEVAKAYGVSDVMIKKVCRKLSIPKPPPGYWARKAHGYKDPQAPLNQLERPVYFETVIHPPEPDKLATLVGLPALQPSPKSIKRSQVVVEIEKKYSKRRTNHRGRTTTNDNADEFNGVQVAPESLGRVFDLLDQLCKLAEANGISITLEKLPNRSGYESPELRVELVAGVDGEKIAIEFYEPLRIKKTPLTEAQLKKKAKHPYSYAHDRIEALVGSGQIELKLVARSNGPTSWRNSPKCPLENVLNEVVQSMFAAAKHKKQEREERRAAELIAQEEQMRLLRFHAKVRRLESNMEAWDRARRVRAYATALAEGFERKGKLGETRVVRCLDWLRQYADSLDPTIDPGTHEDWDIEDDA